MNPVRYTFTKDHDEDHVEPVVSPADSPLFQCSNETYVSPRIYRICEKLGIWSARIEWPCP